MGGEDFVKKDLLAFFFFFGLSAFENAVFVRPNQRDFAAFTQEFAIDSQANTIAKAGVGVVEKTFVGHIFNEGIDIENPVFFDFFKKTFLSYLDQTKAALPNPGRFSTPDQ